MNKLIVTILFAVPALLLAGAGQADEATFARYPAPSPDGSVIAFSYHGDIWTVPAAGGRALRLTVHDAYEYNPIWSPDGSMIAFTSDRFGNDDVFVIKADGGAAKRLTFGSSRDVASDWTADGRNIIFTSNRDYSISGATRVPFVFTIPVDGGEAVVMMPEAGNDPQLSHDGEALAFADHSRRDWGRIGYRGPSNNNIWVWHPKDNSYVKVTTFDGVDAVPMWAGDDMSLYYLSEQSDIYNIWNHNIVSDEKIQVSNHDDHVRFPKISRDGSLIAYELGMDIYTLDTATGSASKVNILAPAGYRENTVERKTFSSGADSFQLSPDNKEIAFTVRGELFVVKEDGGPTIQVTDSSSRDYQAVWNKEGTALFFASDRDGEYDLYMVESDDPEEKKLSRALAFKVTKLTDTDAREWNPDISPDGKKLAYMNGWGSLYVMDLETKESKPLIESWNIGGWSWSPDSNWIAFTQANEEFNNDVYIIPAEGGDAVNVTKHPDNEFNPVWSKDGSKLGFVSRRIGDNFDIWYVWLRKADWEKTKADWEFEKDAPKEPKKDEPEEEAEENGEDEEAEKEEDGKKIEIDFEDIHLRLERVISMAGSENSVAIAPDSETFVFTSNTEGETDLYKVKYDGSELKRLTSGGAYPSNIQFDKKGTKVYFLRRGGIIQSVSMSGKTKTHSYAATMVIDYRAEQMQIYDEAWRTLNERFYDPDFHGADWPAVWEKYRPYAKAAVTRRDLQDVVNMVFGNLNGSHLGFYAAGGGGPRDSSGILGVVYDSGYDGPGYKVKEVFKNSPADKDMSKINVGEIILAINGVKVGRDVNSFSLLNNTVGNRVAVTVAAADDLENKRRVVIRPASERSIGSWMYERFVDAARKKTHEMSDGRIGYLHIQSMGQPSLERFEMELYAEAYDKDAIVIDVRNNGGGWTTDMLLTILDVSDHAWTRARGADESVRGYPQDRRPLYGWTKPIIVLCNEYSYSNAEIFSWAIKTIDRGKVVGQQTFGAVISTGGYGLIDGSFVRTPFRGWYVKGSDINQELNGCPPDIVVEYQPGDTAKGIDRQLETAVNELMKELQ